MPSEKNLLTRPLHIMSRRLWLAQVSRGLGLILSVLALIDGAWWQALIIELHIECAGPSDGAGKAAPSPARGHVSRRQQQRQSKRLVLVLLRCYTIAARVRNLCFRKHYSAATFNVPGLGETLPDSKTYICKT